MSSNDIKSMMDITIPDPKTVKENATYAKGTLPTTGIPYVIVNGTVVVKGSSVLKDVNPGQPIRFPVEPTGRFQPVEVNKWLGTHSINVPDLGQTDDTGTGAIEKR